LLLWYKTHGRHFPWRRTRNAYRTWLAEVLLQRTRSNIVASHYREIVSFLPGTRQLTRTSLATIKRAIFKLGLPHRAHYLKHAGEIIEREYGGQFPRQVEKLRKLPGTGDYTANAVALFAFNQRRFPVDVNVVRVLSRVFDVKSSKKRRHTDNVYQDFLANIVPRHRERDFMYGLLDLASQVCVDDRTRPKCEICPMPALCLWYQRNIGS